MPLRALPCNLGQGGDQGIMLHAHLQKALSELATADWRTLDHPFAPETFK
jgi:hypothetical protein